MSYFFDWNSRRKKEGKGPTILHYDKTFPPSQVLHVNFLKFFLYDSVFRGFNSAVETAAKTNTNLKKSRFHNFEKISIYLSFGLLFKVNSVQKAFAKCLAVHISKFEILHTTWKNKTKNIELVKNWKLRVLLVSFFSCDLQDFKS